MTRPQSVLPWTSAGAVVGFVLGWMSDGIVAGVVLAIVGLAAAAALRPGGGPARPIYALPGAGAVVAVAALAFDFFESEVAGVLVCVVGIVLTVLVARRAGSWSRGLALAVVEFFALLVIAYIAFLLDGAFHGGLE